MTTWIKQSGAGVRLEFLDQEAGVGQQGVGKAMVQKCTENVEADHPGWLGQSLGRGSHGLKNLGASAAAAIHVGIHLTTGERATLGWPFWPWSLSSYRGTQCPELSPDPASRVKPTGISCRLLGHGPSCWNPTKKTKIMSVGFRWRL